MAHTKTAFKPNHFSSIGREIDLHGSRRSKSPKERKHQEFKVDYTPPPYRESLRLTIPEILTEVSLHLCAGMTFTSSELAEKIWPGMTGRDPRWPTVHPYASCVTIVLKSFNFVKRDRYTKIYTVS